MNDSILAEASNNVRVKTENTTETATLSSPQKMDEFHGTSTKDNQNPDIHQIQDPSTAIGEGNTTTIGGENLLTTARNPIGKVKSNPLDSEKSVPLVQDKSSNNTLTPEEILSMKQQNPAETLRKLQKLRQASTDVQPSG